MNQNFTRTPLRNSRSNFRQPRPNVNYQNQYPCFYCGGFCQYASQCPARNAICHLSQKVGHFSRVCQSARRVRPQ